MLHNSKRLKLLLLISGVFAVILFGARFGLAIVANSPHDFAITSKEPCFQCHNMHGTQVSPLSGVDWNDEFAYPSAGKMPIEALICFACHDDTGNIAGNWETADQNFPVENDFGNPHAVPEEVIGKKYNHIIDFINDPTYRCTGCHDQHGVKDPNDNNLSDGVDILPKLLLVKNDVKRDLDLRYIKGARFCFACHDKTSVAEGGLFRPPVGFHDPLKTMPNQSSPDARNNETRLLSDGPDGIPDYWIRDGTYGPVSKRRESAFFYQSKHAYLERRHVDHDSDGDGVVDNPYYDVFGGWGNDIACLVCHRVHGSDLENLIRDNTDNAACGAGSCHPPAVPVDVPKTITNETDLCFTCHDPPALYPYKVQPGSPATFIIEGHRADKSKYSEGHGAVQFTIRDKDAPNPWDTTYDTTWTGLDCGDCHDQHGTGQYKMALKKTYDVHNDVFDSGAGERQHDYTSTLYDTDVGVDGDTIANLCFACHANPAYTTYDMAGQPESSAYYNGKAPYNASAHSGLKNYTPISATADDCVSCHDTHGTGLSSMVFKMGEELCYTCHTDPADAVGTPGPDIELDFFYGDRTHRHDIKTEDQKGADGTAGTDDDTKIECINCHNVHMATADSPITVPEYPWANISTEELHSKNSYQKDVILGDAGATETVYFCYGCHDGDAPSGLTPLEDIKGAPNIANDTLPGKSWWGSADQRWTTAQTPVPIYDGGHMFINESPSYYPDTGSLENPRKLPCVECHEHHGSINVHLLRDDVANGFDTTSTTETKRAFCINCHNGTRVIGGVTVLAPPTGEIDGMGYGADSPDGDDFVRQHDSSDPVYGQWSCLVCHNPHDPRPDYLTFGHPTAKAGHSVNSECLSCHTENKGNPFPKVNAQIYDTTGLYKSRHDVDYNATGNGCDKCHERDHSAHGINYDIVKVDRVYQSVVRDPDRTNGTGSGGGYSPYNNINYKTSTEYCLECHRGQYYGDHDTKDTAPGYGGDIGDQLPPQFGASIPNNIAIRWFSGGHAPFKYSDLGLDLKGDPPHDNVVCFDCHEHHASTVGTSLVKQIDGKVVANDETLCYACHENFSPTLPMWPGKEIYDSSFHDIGHTGQGVPIENQGAWDGTAKHASVTGSCQNCHDPHGIAEIVDPDTTGDWRYDTTGDGIAEVAYPSMLYDREEELCFRCHDGTNAQDIKQFFDTSSSFSAHWITDWQQVGPDGVSGTPDDGKVECTDCHNPHIMKGDKIVKWPGHPLENHTAFDDVFCVACHADDTDGDSIPDGIPAGVKFPFIDENNDGHNDRVWPRTSAWNSAQLDYSKRINPLANPGDPDWSPPAYCVECHNPHGGERKQLIRGWVMGVNIAPIDSITYPNDPAYSKEYIDLREEELCFICHDDETSLTAWKNDTTNYEPGDPEYQKDFNVTYADNNDIKQFYVKEDPKGTYDMNTRTTSHHNVFYIEQVGADGRPGVAGVDDNNDGFIDDEDEIGADGSDDAFGPDGIEGTEDDGVGAVECEDCHDHHVAQYNRPHLGEYPTTDPFYPHNPMLPDQKFCLRCHDNNPPTRVKGLSYGSKKNIMISYNPNGNTYYDAKYPAKELPVIEPYEGHHLQDAGAPLLCKDCHNPHGSNYMKQLRDNTYDGAPGGWDTTSFIQNMQALDLNFNDNGTADPFDDSGDLDTKAQSNAAERCLTCHSGGTSVDNPGAVTNLIPLPAPPSVSWDEYFGPDKTVHKVNLHPTYPSGLSVLTALNAGGQKGTTKSVYAWSRVFNEDTYVPMICTNCHDSHNPYVRSNDEGEILYCYQCHNENSGIPDIQTEFNMTPGKEDWAASIHSIKYDPAAYELSGNINDLECLKCHDQAGNHLSKNIHLVNPPGGQYDSTWTGTGLGAQPNGHVNDFCLGCHQNPNYASDQALQFMGKDAQGNSGPHPPPQIPPTYVDSAHFKVDEGNLKCTDCHQHHGSKGLKLRQMFNERDPYYDQNWHSEYDSTNYGKDYDSDGTKGLIEPNDGHYWEELQEEAFCLYCHDQPNNSVNGLDIATIFNMSAPGARHAIFDVDQMGLNGVDDSPDTQPNDDALIECESCHNPHAVGRYLPVTDPHVNPAQQVAIVSDQAFCIMCHGDSVPAIVKFPLFAKGAEAPEWNGTDWNPWNKAYFPESAHAINDTEGLVCINCHDPHGGGNYRTIRKTVYNPFDSSNHNIALPITLKTRTTVPEGKQRFEPENENDFCLACHIGELGVYPGKAGWLARDFGNQTSAGGDAGKDKNCTYCHNPHGSSQEGIKLLRHSKPLNLQYSSPYFGDLIPESAYNSGVGTSTEAVGNIICLSQGCHSAPVKNNYNKVPFGTARYDSFDIDKDFHLTKETYGRDSATTYGSGTGSHHPIEEGVTLCWSCHDAHGTANDPVASTYGRDPSLKQPYYREEKWPGFYMSGDGDGYAYNSGTVFGNVTYRSYLKWNNPPADANDLCFMCHRKEDIIGPDGAAELNMDNSNTNFQGHEVMPGGAEYSKNIAQGLTRYVGIPNGIQQDFHGYSCSMCHRPHATRREKLLKTNCYARAFNSPYQTRGTKRYFWSGGGRQGAPMQGECHPYESSWGSYMGQSYIGWRTLRMTKTDFIRPQLEVSDLTIIVSPAFPTGNLGEETLAGTALTDILPYQTDNGPYHMQNDVLLQWTAVEDQQTPGIAVDHYRVYISDDPIVLHTKNDAVRLLEKVAEGVTTIGEKVNFWMPYGNVNDGKSYYYAVIAVDADENESMLSNTVGELMDVPDTTSPPPAVIQITQLAGTYFAQVSWDDPRDNGDTVEYDIERAPDVAGSPGAYGNVSTQPDTDLEAAFLTDPRSASGGQEFFTQSYDAINNGDIYWYRVISRDSASLTSTSQGISILIKDPVPGQITTLRLIDLEPSIVDYPMTESGTTIALLEWTVPQDGGFDGSTITNYHVYRYYQTFAVKDPAKLIISAAYDTTKAEYKFTYDSTDHYSTTIPDPAPSYNNCGIVGSIPDFVQGEQSTGWGTQPWQSVTRAGVADGYRVVYQHTFDPDELYYMNITYYQPSTDGGRAQILRLDSGESIHGPLVLPEDSSYNLSYPVPQSAYTPPQSTNVQFYFEPAGVPGKMTVVSEITFIRRSKITLSDLIPKDTFIRDSAFVETDLDSYYFYYGVTAEDDAVPTTQEGALSNVVDIEMPRSVSNLQAALQANSAVNLTFDALPQRTHPNKVYGDYAVAMYARHKRGTLDDITGYSTSNQSVDIGMWDVTELSDSIKNQEPGAWEFSVFVQFTDGQVAPIPYRVLGEVTYDGALGESSKHKNVYVVLGDPTDPNAIFNSVSILDWDGSQTNYTITDVFPGDYNVQAYIDMDDSNPDGGIGQRTDGDYQGAYVSNPITVVNADVASINIAIDEVYYE